MPGINDSLSRSELRRAIKDKRTRRRRIRACENCRSSKTRCTMYPNRCERCLVNNLKCFYLPQNDEGWEIIERKKEEHQRIDDIMAKIARESEDIKDEHDDGSDIEPNPLIATDAAYEDDDDFEDNGVRIGRFNLTKRLGSDYRPKLMEEMTQMLDKNDMHRSEHDRTVFNSLPRPHWLDAAAGAKALNPDPDYIAPSLFSHTLHFNHQIHRILRSQDLADRIMEQYWECVHPVACIVHRPSFQERYDMFWSNTSRGVRDTPESTQAVVYAALFAGVVSMDAECVRTQLGGEREEWVNALEKATAISLSRAHVIRTTKPETIQAFVMYLIPLCRAIVSRTLATLVASAIDLARGMGLNRDGTRYGDDPVVTQVHRMIWHQLCYLDIRVCEAQSPRARIRREEFDTHFPLNVDDSELEASDLREDVRGRWTDMTFSNARMECNEKIREIYAAQQRTRQGIDTDSAYITKMLDMIDGFRIYMEAKYYPMIDDRIPIQHYARLVIDLHCRRMHAMVLHEYHMSTPRRRLPEEWSQIVINSGLETMEIAKEIETCEFLRLWRWYAGALQQHNYAALMLVEAFAYPGTRHAIRSWKSLDWIFQVPSCIPYNHKARWVMEGAVGVMKEYLKARKLRCPTLMDERLGIASSSSHIPTLPKPRKLAAKPTKTVIVAQSRSKVTSRSDRALPQTSMKDNMRSEFRDTTTTSVAQVIAMDGVKYENQETKSLVGDLVASASSRANPERFSSEEDPYIRTTPGTSADESTDSPSSRRLFSYSASPTAHSGYSSAENLTKPVSSSGTRAAADDRRGSVRRVSSTSSTHIAQDHDMDSPRRFYHGDTLAMQDPPHVPARFGSWPDDDDDDSSQPASQSRYNSYHHHHNNSRILDEGLWVHMSDRAPPVTFKRSWGFTPINENSVYRSPYG